MAKPWKPDNERGEACALMIKMEKKVGALTLTKVDGRVRRVEAKLADPI
jgi:hypothetical protein